MGFLDNVKDALRDAVTSQASKDAAAKKDDVVVDSADTPAADDSATPVDTDSTSTADAETVEPTVEPTPESVAPAPTEAAEEAREAKFETYTVKTGDSLSEIGARFGVSHQEIAKLNSIENPDLIFPGQVFRIPKN
jgi:nucleoid-associated protein YgaU